MISCAPAVVASLQAVYAGAQVLLSEGESTSVTSIYDCFCVEFPRE